MTKYKKKLKVFLQWIIEDHLKIMNVAFASALNILIFVFHQFRQEGYGFGEERLKVLTNLSGKLHAGSQSQESEMESKMQILHFFAIKLLILCVRKNFILASLC